MAQRSIFAFDDDDDRYEGGGFQAPPTLDDEAETPDTDPEGEALEPDAKPEPKVVDKPAEPETEIPPAPTPDPIDDWKKQSQEQYDFLRDQMIRVNQDLAETKKKLEEATRKPIEKPTDDDWVNDPTAAAEKLIQAKRAEDEARAATERQDRIKTAQAASVQKVLDVAPIFKTDQALQADLNREFYSNPEFMNDPDGPFKAAQAVARRHYRPPAPVQTEQPARVDPAQQQTPADTQSVEDKAAQAERNRVAMAKKNVMHGGGKSHSKVTTVDPKLAALARKHGVSIDTIKMMEGVE